MGDAQKTSLYALALIVIVGLAFALRLLVLDSQSLWYDEGVTAMIAQRGVADLTRWTANDIQPPLYYYGVAGWGRLAGWSEWSLRFPSVVFGVLLVPLMAALALHLSGRRRVALLAALFSALHPLLLYYGQEARMYTLLAVLCVLTGYLLVRGADAPKRGWVFWGLYVVSASAATYTHYFAFFVLLGLGLAFMLDLIFQNRWEAAGTRAISAQQVGGIQTSSVHTALLGYLLANLGVLLLYVPWFLVLFTQLRVDRSYWAGALKIGEALSDALVGFSSGETVTESLALWLLIPLLTITGWSVYQLWRGDFRERRQLIYGVLWFLVPLIAVLALAINVPKYNARYVLVALPGLLLIWSGGLAIRPRAPSSPGRSRLNFQRIISTILTATLLLVFVFADAGWYLNPAFTKDQWREVAVFMRERLRDDEAVILVSGHAWPVWEYYAPDIPVVRLPDLEILDVNAVLDFAATGRPLQEAFAESSGKQGAWLINWQDEVVDPNEVTPVQFELSGREKGQPSTFFGLSVRRYSGLRPHRFQAEPPVDHPLNVDFGGKVMLRGYKVLNNGDLLLFWELPEAESSADLHFLLQSTDENGGEIVSLPGRRLAGYTYPTFRWPASTVVMGRVAAADWLGASPQQGQYGFSLHVYDGNDPTARPLPIISGDDTLRVGPVEVIID